MCLDSIKRKLNKQESEEYGEVTGYKLVVEVEKGRYRPVYYSCSIVGFYETGKSVKNLRRTTCGTENVETNGCRKGQKWSYQSGFHVYLKLKDAQADLAYKNTYKNLNLCVVRVKCKGVRVIGKQEVHYYINKDHSEPKYADCIVCDEMKVERMVTR